MKLQEDVFVMRRRPLASTGEAIARAASRTIGREVPLLIAVVAAAFALWGFVEVASAVSSGGSHALDRRLLLALRVPDDPARPIGPAWLSDVVRDFTALGSNGVLTMTTALAAGYLLVTGRRLEAVTLVGTIVSAIALNNLMKIGFDRPRPDVVAHAVAVHTRSFPSGHAALSATVYLTIGGLIAHLQTPRMAKLYVWASAVLLTVLIGATRVYLGVHWPTDVLAGWAIGAAWALLSVALLTRRGWSAERTGDTHEGGSRE